MKSKEAMTFDQYKMQKLNSEFGNFVMIASSDALSSKNVKSYMKNLAGTIGEFISKQGYKPSEKAKVIIKVPSSMFTCDPTDHRATVGGKTECKLTATKDQYVFYASEIIGELKGECKRQIEKTWKDRLFEYLTSSFYEGHPFIDPCEKEDRELEDKFIKKRDKLIAKIESLVGKF